MGTDSFESYLEEQGDETRQRLLDGIALERWGSPEEIGRACLFLASDACGYVNRAVVYADGGAHSAARPTS